MKEFSMLQVKDAVKQARAYLPELMFEGPHQIADLRLEEVEISEDEKFWAVTFSYMPLESANPIPLRQYKTVRIKANNGDFVGVRNGMLAA
jgi:hypothetical protein